MTKKEIWTKANSDKTAEFLFYLRERWSDESEYEDINEYLTAIQKSIPEAFKIYKRPFGFDCKADDGILNVSIVVQGNYLKLKAKSK